jgi:hypothetical protein
VISVAQALEERLAVVAGRHPELVPIPRWLQEHRTSNISLKGFVYDTDNIRPDLTGKLQSCSVFFGRVWYSACWCGAGAPARERAAGCHARGAASRTGLRSNLE